MNAVDLGVSCARCRRFGKWILRIAGFIVFFSRIETLHVWGVKFTFLECVVISFFFDGFPFNGVSLNALCDYVKYRVLPFSVLLQELGFCGLDF